MGNFLFLMKTRTIELGQDVGTNKLKVTPATFLQKRMSSKMSGPHQGLQEQEILRVIKEKEKFQRDSFSEGNSEKGSNKDLLCMNGCFTLKGITHRKVLTTHKKTATM